MAHTPRKGVNAEMSEKRLDVFGERGKKLHESFKRPRSKVARKRDAKLSH